MSALPHSIKPHDHDWKDCEEIWITRWVGKCQMCQCGAISVYREAQGDDEAVRIMIDRANITFLRDYAPTKKKAEYKSQPNRPKRSE